MTLFLHQEPVHESVRRQHRPMAVAGFPIRVRAVTESPLATRGDAHVNRFVLVEIEALGDLLRGFDRNGAFFGRPPEEERSSQPIHEGLLSGTADNWRESLR